MEMEIHRRRGRGGDEGEGEAERERRALQGAGPLLVQREALGAFPHDLKCSWAEGSECCVRFHPREAPRFM